MTELLQIGQGIVERGLIFGVIVAAVYLASKLIDFDNLAVEGGFGLGGALTALMITKNFNPWLALVTASLVGGASGILTGLLNTKLKLNHLISGIIITTGLFSIMLKISGSNLTLGSKATIFKMMPSFLSPYESLALMMIICAVLLVAITLLLKTEIGFLLQAVGCTPQMLVNVGKNPDNYKILGLALSNGLAALSGALFVQYTGYFSIWASVGVLVIGLAGMIIADTISSNFGISLLLGAIAYQAIIALTFELQINQDWNKLVTATLIVVLILIKQQVSKKGAIDAKA